MLKLLERAVAVPSQRAEGVVAGLGSQIARVGPSATAVPLGATPVPFRVVLLSNSGSNVMSTTPSKRNTLAWTTARDSSE